MIGRDGGLWLDTPWLGEHRAEEGRDALRPLLELPVERVFVGHGEPVLEGGREALEQRCVSRLRPTVSEPRTRSSAATNAFDHSARSGQPVHETMFPSTTAAPSTYVPPASSMSGPSGGKPELFRPWR